MSPQRILVRAPNWIGDQMLAYPFFYYLRDAYPRAHITVVCVPWVAAVQFQHLVDEVHVMAPAPPSSLWTRAQVLEASAHWLRRHGPWDLGLCLPNSFSSAWLLMRAQVAQRRGYATDRRAWLLHESLSWQEHAADHRTAAYVALLPTPVRPQHSVHEFWSLLADRAGVHTGPARQQLFAAARAWPAASVLEPPAAPYWVLAPGSLAESRRWPAEQCLELARRISQATGMPGLVVGGPQEHPLAQRLCQAPGSGLQDWTARGSVAVYWQLFRQARFTVSNDSGLAHVAALCGSPVYITWGAGNIRRTAPLGPGPVHILHNPIDCWPCERNACHQPAARTLACLRGIEVAAVWEAIQQA
ncbi:MAG: glycosyltransferase family 9 protein [Candidatus Tectimicrobiota bacterium]